MLNYDDAKKTQTKQKTPFLPYFALLAEHLFKYPCIQRRALRLLLFQHRLISGMAWEGAECQVSRAKEAAQWVHGSYCWGGAGGPGFVQVTGQEVTVEGGAGAFLFL